MCDSGVICEKNLDVVTLKGLKSTFRMSFVTPKSKLSQRQIEGHENAISNRREHPIFVFSVGGAHDL